MGDLDIACLDSAADWLESAGVLLAPYCFQSYDHWAAYKASDLCTEMRQAIGDDVGGVDKIANELYPVLKGFDRLPQPDGQQRDPQSGRHFRPDPAVRQLRPLLHPGRRVQRAHHLHPHRGRVHEPPDRPGRL